MAAKKPTKRPTDFIKVGDKTFKLKFGKVPLTQSVNTKAIQSLEILRKRKNLSTVQDVVNVAIGDLLEREGLDY